MDRIGNEIVEEVPGPRHSTCRAGVNARSWAGIRQTRPRVKCGSVGADESRVETGGSRGRTNHGCGVQVGFQDVDVDRWKAVAFGAQTPGGPDTYPHIIGGYADVDD